MKKLLAIVLAAVLALCSLPFAAFADGADLPSMMEYEGAGYCNLDTVFKENQEFVSELGKGLGYLSEREYKITEQYQVLCLAGWVAFDQDIKAFGYRIDGGEVVIVEEAYRTSEDAVVAAAKTANCDYSARFEIPANVAELKGTHVIDYLVKLADDKVYIITAAGNDLTITYEGEADPEATPTPAPVEEDVVLPGIYFTFDEEDKYDTFFSAGKEVEDIGWNAEEKCEQLVVTTSTDPYITMNVPLAANDFFDDDLDCSKYKVLQIGVKVDANHGNGGQIYYTTDESTEPGETQVASLAYKNTTDFQALTVNFTKNRRWTGILTTLRYDVFGTLNADESTVNVYYVAFFETKADADAFAKVFAVKGYDAFPVVATPTPKPTNTPTPTPTATPDVTEAPVEPEVTEAATEIPAGDDKDNKTDSGCGSVVGGGAVVVAAAMAAFIIRRRKH